ncbi:hypothetical protein M5689_019493 [Euphorbia peplus]|nr:hypothetical protein M5689_019493 [Euphorbia peplus]
MGRSKMKSLVVCLALISLIMMINEVEAQTTPTTAGAVGKDSAETSDSVSGKPDNEYNRGCNAATRCRT